MPYTPRAYHGQVDDPSRTQVLRPVGDTEVIPKVKESRRSSSPARQSQKPGPVMRVFGRALSIMFAGFCLTIIGITFAFAAWKYYDHLFH